MGKKRGPYKKKDKFADIEESFKDAVVQSSPEEIKKRVSEIALLECSTRAIIKVDPKVVETKAAYKEAMEDYRADLKAYKLKMEYCLSVLEAKGAPSTKEELTAAAITATTSKSGPAPTAS